MTFDENALSVVERGRVDTVRWSDIAHVVPDEDRLVVEVTPREGAPFVIEPRYGGLGMYELAAAIEEARIEGCASDRASLQLRRSAGRDHG